MSINFATLQALDIPEGVVTQITDASGRVIWAVSGGKVILEVEKITSDTYAGETTYTGEQFILLDIYPKTNGTVKVTYGGLTKTITDTSGAEEPNAQQVFFGTFNGVSDGVTTPASGELVIEGNFYAFGCGQFAASSKNSLTKSVCSCITSVVDFGNITNIPAKAFFECSTLALTELPEGVTSIGLMAFSMPYENGLITAMPNTITLPSTITNIGERAFVTSVSSTSGDTSYYTFLSEVRILAKTPPTLGTNVFASTRIIVPLGCGEAYKAAEGWSKYANYIVEAP